MPDWKDEAQRLATLRAVELGRRLRPGQSVYPYLVPAIRVFSDIISSGVGRTFEGLMREVAVLCAWAQEGKARTYDGPRVQGGERPEPSPHAVWAAEKLRRLEERWWGEMLELRGFNEQPHDPAKRLGTCPNCDAKRYEGNRFCGQCGRFLASPAQAEPPTQDEKDELVARRRHRSRRCRTRGCANRDKRLPPWMAVCNVCGREAT